MKVVALQLSAIIAAWIIIAALVSMPSAKAAPLQIPVFQFLESQGPRIAEMTEALAPIEIGGPLAGPITVTVERGETVTIRVGSDIALHVETGFARPVVYIHSDVIVTGSITAVDSAGLPIATFP